ncbi:hypothetical protein HYDPIDRAFT_187395 [Hydnomerulius pinastri MD-312]|nr:hypothetical protein HYDPIDRAFT_187395 [Hydnomerulius pinastri MD-312]
MHPFHHVYLHRGPSRIFWFILGAGAATWWHYSRSMREHRAQYFPCVMQQRRLEGQNGDTSGYSPRPSDPPAPQEGGRWVWKASWGPDQDGTVGWKQREWDEDKERLKNMQKRAGDAVVDMSESTLDSIVSAAESLKAKLAEHRAQRGELMKQNPNGLRADAEKKDSQQGA